MSLAIASAAPVSPSNGAHGADTALAWMERSTKRLALPLPIAVANTLGDALPYPLDDARYANNALVPGRAPLEVSFSDAQPTVLRVDFEPYDPGVPPIEKREKGASLLQRWVTENFAYGVAQDSAHWLDALCGSSIGAPAKFGAFLGISVDVEGLAEAKLYAEWNGEVPAGLPARLAATADRALATVPGLVPHFSSLSCNRSGCVPRLYFLCREELPLLALREVLDTAGLIHRLPQFAVLLSPFLAEATILPAGAAVLSFRQDEHGLDCKLELLVGALPSPQSVIAAQLSRCVAGRRDTAAEFRRWCCAVGNGLSSPGNVNAVGFRVSAGGPPQFAVYVSPFGELNR